MHEMGIRNESLHQILIGMKTVEGRLATPRFQAFQAGDTIMVREDTWQDGKIVSSRPKAATVIITRIDHFPSFRNMLQELGYEHFRPTDTSIDEALKTYARYYSAEDEAKFGVVAIHLRLPLS